jgi:hypothetical protein
VKPPLPHILGSEFAGTVEAIGEGVTGIQLGGCVFGIVQIGEPAGCAQYVVTSAETVRLYPYTVLDPTALRNALTELADLVANNRLHIHLGTQLPLSLAAQAHRLIEDRQTTGKAVLLPWADWWHKIGANRQCRSRCLAYSLPVLKSALPLRTADSRLQFSGWTRSQRLPLPRSLPSLSSRLNHSSAVLILLGWISSSRS